MSAPTSAKMPLNDAIRELRRHQSWRLGADIAATNPKTLTQAIEVVLDAAERFSENLEAIKIICGESR